MGRMKNTFSKKIAGKYVRSKSTGEKPAAVLVEAAAVRCLAWVSHLWPCVLVAAVGRGGGGDRAVGSRVAPGAGCPLDCRAVPVLGLGLDDASCSPIGL